MPGPGKRVSNPLVNRCRFFLGFICQCRSVERYGRGCHRVTTAPTTFPRLSTARRRSMATSSSPPFNTMASAAERRAWPACSRTFSAARPVLEGRSPSAAWERRAAAIAAEARGPRRSRAGGQFLGIGEGGEGALTAGARSDLVRTSNRGRSVAIGVEKRGVMVSPARRRLRGQARDACSAPKDWA